MKKTVESIENKMFRLRKAINEIMPYEICEYRNMIIADGIAKGNADKMTEDWIRKVLLSDVDDGFITYNEALELAPKYIKAISELKRIA